MRFAALAACATLATSEVVELTASNYELTVGGELPVFVKFYAPWCGHCKRIAPDWERLAEDATLKDKIIIAKIDCTVEEAPCTKGGVKGYPTLKLFEKHQDTAERYEGGRTFDDLREFIGESLGDGCSPDAPENCTEQEKEYIKKWAGKADGAAKVCRGTS